MSHYGLRPDQFLTAYPHHDLSWPSEDHPAAVSFSQHILWSAQNKVGVHVSIAQKVGTGYKFICDLGASSFTTDVARQHMGQFTSAAAELHRLSKQSTTGNALPGLMTKQAAVVTAEDLVVADIKANACKVLSAGCFAAGTKLLTRSGWRAVETIRPGDEVLSRSEHDWSAQAEWKVVEERFERTGCILHLHVSGEVIRTTPEHPFFVQGEGWKQAGALEGGDRIATLSGEWVSVEEVFDTQEWEPVYNLRVADFHTYFVGDEHWGFAAWRIISTSGRSVEVQGDGSVLHW